MKKFFLLYVLSYCAIVLLSPFTSCNNDGSKKESSDTSAISETSEKKYQLVVDSSQGHIEDSIELATLKSQGSQARERKNETYEVLMTAEQLDFLFNSPWSGGPVVGLKFRFKGKNDRYSLKVCGVDEDGDRTQWIDLTEQATIIPNPRNLIRADQIIKISEMRTLLGLSGSGPIGKDQFRNIYLKANEDEHPQREHPTKDYIYLLYSDSDTFMSKGETAFAILSTNPCPPCAYCIPVCIETISTKNK